MHQQYTALHWWWMGCRCWRLQKTPTQRIWQTLPFHRDSNSCVVDCNKQCIILCKVDLTVMLTKPSMTMCNKTTARTAEACIYKVKWVNKKPNLLNVELDLDSVCSQFSWNFRFLVTITGIRHQLGLWFTGQGCGYQYHKNAALNF